MEKAGPGRGGCNEAFPALSLSTWVLTSLFDLALTGLTRVILA